MDRLPLHLLNEVLFKLKDKSLAMLQCTNRFLQSHISNDPYFVSEYLNRVGSGLFHVPNVGAVSLYSYPFGDSRSFISALLGGPVFHVLGSCSGLLLLFVDDLCVANPLTAKVRFLDHSKSKHVPAMFRGPVDQKNRIGFAVDQIDGHTQRFKVVCLVELVKDLDETMYQFEINVGDSSCWRLSAESTITCRSSHLVTKPVYLDGALHWLRNDGSIVAFNPETEKARLILIKSPPEQSSKMLFEAAGNELTLITATEEVIHVYALKNILTDPKWVLVRRIGNGVLDKELIYWNVGDYDGKRLVLYENKKEGDGVVHEYDLRAMKWEVIGSIPWWCHVVHEFYQYKPSLSSAIQLDEMVACNDERFSTLGMIMRLIGEISPYALKLLNKKRLVEEEEEEEKRLKIGRSNKRIRVK